MRRVAPAAVISALAACLPPGPPSSTPAGPPPAPVVGSLPTIPSGRCAQFTDGLPCIDVDAVEPSISVSDPDRLLTGLQIVSDVDGDGLPDLAASLSEANSDDENAGTHYIVYGPLTRPIVLPDDASVTFGPGDGPRYYGDATGDGVVDVTVIPGGRVDGTWELVPGPLPTAVDVATASIGRFLGEVDDLDHDGDLDLHVEKGSDGVEGPPALEIWTGPAHTWSGPPTVTITHPCSDGVSAYFGNETPQFSNAWPDFDGDGVNEVAVSGCGQTYVLPVTDLVGTIDLATRAEARGPLDVIPDQDGDGDPEWVVAADGEYSLVAGPLSYDSDVPPTAAGSPLFTLAPGLVFHENLLHIGVDFDGDGVTDFVGDGGSTPLGDGAVGVVLTGGPTGGIVTGSPSHRIISAPAPETYCGGAWFAHGDELVSLTSDCSSGTMEFGTARVLALPRN